MRRPDKPETILDRDREWHELAAAWQRPGPELIIVLGRRRAGKSFLLKHFSESVDGMYYQATKRTEGDQLARLSAMVGQQVGGLGGAISFPDWEAFLDYVTSRAATKPYLLVLDEFTYLADASPALPSIVQSYWDHRWSGTGLKLVLSGSHITAMLRLESADQPLYGRRTVRLDVHPFDYFDAARFLESYSPRDRLRAYGIFGGLPGHLAFLDTTVPLEENVMRHMLQPTGRLVDDAQHLLDAFLSDARDHYSILEAVANGEKTYSGITSRTGLKGGAAQRAFQWLQNMRLVEKQVPITEKNASRSKRGLYRIDDPYVAFWHRFIAPLINAGSVGISPAEQLWTESISPWLDAHMGPVFEAACRAFVRRGKRLPFAATRVGTWWDRRTENEIDVVALGRGRILAGECKWGRVDGSDLRSLRERAAMLVAELGTPSAELHLALFAGGPVDREVQAEAAARRVLLFEMADLYATER
jgi:hypothetical protein